MAMNGNDLGDAITTAIKTLAKAEQQDVEAVMRVIGTALVTYIQQNAAVSGTVSGGSITSGQVT